MFKEKIIKELQKIKRQGSDKFICWLKKSDFFTAPCSKEHHLNKKGGLAKHSWNVYQLFKEKNKRYDLGLSEETTIICGLLHDVCKIGFYKKIKKGWDYDDKFPVGHGEKSVITLLRWFALTEKECCIIRWHMSGFDLSPYGKPAYYQAVKMHPACIALHTADYEATTFLE